METLSKIYPAVFQPLLSHLSHFEGLEGRQLLNHLSDSPKNINFKKLDEYLEKQQAGIAGSCFLGCHGLLSQS